jgi:hypothetical protein
MSRGNYTKPKRFGRVVIEQERDGVYQPYLDRVYLWRTRWFSIRFHKILMSDLDRHLHDHPWNWFTFMVKGAYFEETAGGGRVIHAGMMNGHKAETGHKLTLLTPEVWTIFITGRHLREWGFLTENGWVHHKEYGNEGREVSM